MISCLTDVDFFLGDSVALPFRMEDQQVSPYPATHTDLHIPDAWAHTYEPSCQLGLSSKLIQGISFLQFVSLHNLHFCYLHLFYYSCISLSFLMTPVYLFTSSVIICTNWLTALLLPWFHVHVQIFVHFCHWFPFICFPEYLLKTNFALLHFYDYKTILNRQCSLEQKTR